MAQLSSMYGVHFYHMLVQMVMLFRKMQLMMFHTEEEHLKLHEMPLMQCPYSSSLDA